MGNGATAETEAPASRRKPPATATPSTYSHRARRRLYPPFRVTLDFTGVIGISGRHRGAVYFTSGAEQLTELLRRFGETEIGFSEHEDLVGEVANTIAGNARQYFGSEFLISVPLVLFGRPDKISFPRHLKSFVIPITWRSHRSYLIICLERATERATERDARELSSRPDVIAGLQP